MKILIYLIYFYCVAKILRTFCIFTEYFYRDVYGHQINNADIYVEFSRISGVHIGEHSEVLITFLVVFLYIFTAGAFYVIIYEQKLAVF